MNWKNMSVLQKIATIISVLACAVWLICKAKSDLLPIDLTFPAIAVFTLCEAVVCWKERRKWAYVLIAATVISIAFCVLEFMM